MANKKRKRQTVGLRSGPAGRDGSIDVPGDDSAKLGNVSPGEKGPNWERNKAKRDKKKEKKRREKQKLLEAQEASQGELSNGENRSPVGVTNEEENKSSRPVGGDDGGSVSSADFDMSTYELTESDIEDLEFLDRPEFKFPQEARSVAVDKPSRSSSRLVDADSKKRRLICDMDRMESNLARHDKVYFEGLLGADGGHFGKMMTTRAQEESRGMFQRRQIGVHKAYQLVMSRWFKKADGATGAVIHEYNGGRFPTNGNGDEDQIVKVRYEPETSTFTVFFGVSQLMRKQRRSGAIVSGYSICYLSRFLPKGFVQACIKYGIKCHQKGWNQPTFHVPIGDSNCDVAPDICLVKFRSFGGRTQKFRFVQGRFDYCLAYSVANALHYLGHTVSARCMQCKAAEISVLDAMTQLNSVGTFVHQVRGLGLKNTKRADLDNFMVGCLGDVHACMDRLRSEAMVVFVPRSGDGTNTHAITYVNGFMFGDRHGYPIDGLLFDSTQEYPMRLSVDSLCFVAGSAGFAGIFRAKIFVRH